MTQTRLVDLRVGEFVDAVASSKQAVPAGGSVAALTGAAGAALLALVCGVLQRREPNTLRNQLHEAAELQRELLSLVDEDADAFRSKSAEWACRVPLGIATACTSVSRLTREVERHVSGSLVGDVRAARHLAIGARDAALDIAELNLESVADPGEKQALQQKISLLRRRRGR